MSLRIGLGAFESSTLPRKCPLHRHHPSSITSPTPSSCPHCRETYIHTLTSLHFTAPYERHYALLTFISTLLISVSAFLINVSLPVIKFGPVFGKLEEVLLALLFTPPPPMSRERSSSYAYAHESSNIQPEISTVNRHTCDHGHSPGFGTQIAEVLRKALWALKEWAPEDSYSRQAYTFLLICIWLAAVSYWLALNLLPFYGYLFPAYPYPIDEEKNINTDLRRQTLHDVEKSGDYKPEVEDGKCVLEEEKEVYDRYTYGKNTANWQNPTWGTRVQNFNFYSVAWVFSATATYVYVVVWLGVGILEQGFIAGPVYLGVGGLDVFLVDCEVEGDEIKVEERGDEEEGMSGGTEDLKSEKEKERKDGGKDGVGRWFHIENLKGGLVWDGDGDRTDEDKVQVMENYVHAKVGRSNGCHFYQT